MSRPCRFKRHLAQPGLSKQAFRKQKRGQCLPALHFVSVIEHVCLTRAGIAHVSANCQQRSCCLPQMHVHLLRMQCQRHAIMSSSKYPATIYQDQASHKKPRRFGLLVKSVRHRPPHCL